MARTPLLTVLALGALLLGGCAGPDEGGAPEPSVVVGEETTPASEPSQETEPTTAPTEEAASGAGGDAPQEGELAAQLEALIVGELPAVALQFSDDLQRDCQSTGLGCYVRGESAIFVSPGLADFRGPEILAHEYLHHVWFRDGLDDDAPLTSALEGAFADGEGLGALVPDWQPEYVRADGSIEPTELFSYACTGLRPDQMPEVVAERCAEYLELGALPVNQQVQVGALLSEIAALREAAGLEGLADSPYAAAAASEARAELFTPYSQVPLGEFPESVTQHLNAGCSPSRYAARLTRPYDPAQMVADIDATLQGALSSADYSGGGIAVKEFDYINADAVFGDRTLRVNATLVVVTVCE